MTAGLPSAREALGAKPGRRWRMDPIPIAGPERVVALARLRATLANDLVATLDNLILNGWGADDYVDAAHSYAAWLHEWLAGAIGEGLDRWGRLP